MAASTIFIIIIINITIIIDIQFFKNKKFLYFQSSKVTNMLANFFTRYKQVSHNKIQNCGLIAHYIFRV